MGSARDIEADPGDVPVLRVGQEESCAGHLRWAGKSLHGELSCRSGELLTSNGPGFDS